MTITSGLTVKEKTDAGLVCDMQITDQDGKPCVRGTVVVAS